MTSTSFLKSLEKSEVGRQVLAEEQAAVQAHRVELAAELARLRAEHLAMVTPLIKAEAEAKAKLVRAEEAVVAARKVLVVAQQALFACSNTHTRRRLAIESELTATAPAIIGEFIGALRNLHDKVAREVINVPSGRGKPNPEDMQRLQKAVDRKNGRIARVLAIIPEAETLRLAAFDEVQLTMTLAAFGKAAQGKD